jgi:hypothetical protein
MCPAVTVRNWADYSPLLAAGSNTGNILIYNVSTGQRTLLGMFSKTGRYHFSTTDFYD